MVILFICSCIAPKNGKMNNYNSKVKFKLKQEILFPDFSIQYMGKETVQGPNQAKWKMTIYHFQVLNDDINKKISWSSGSGDIGPLLFEFNNKNFALELKYSEILESDNNLKENELVITRYD
ncbi:hypothetical protein PP180_08055 [Muricauda sp. SK9]|nr:hypothetical protein [Muricauda sp. SK9]